MRLKVLTTTCLIAGLLLMLAWPVVVGFGPPEGASRIELARWGQRALVYFIMTTAAWLSTAFSAFLLAKQSKREFLQQERDNLKSLIEGTLKDHGKDA